MQNNYFTSEILKNIYFDMDCVGWVNECSCNRGSTVCWGHAAGQGGYWNTCRWHGDTR